MMFRLEFSMDNAAFEDESELARVLDRVRYQVGAFGFSREAESVRDSNGNTIGQWEVTGDE